MPPAPIAVPAEAADLYSAYLEWLRVRGVTSKPIYCRARSFFARFPDPQAWAALPLERRLADGTRMWPLLNFLMLHGYLHPGYDYLMERKLSRLLREAPASPLGPDLARFLAGAEVLGYTVRTSTAMVSTIAARLLIQTGRGLDALTDDDFCELQTAIEERQAQRGRRFAHYRNILNGARAVIYHEAYFDGVRPHIRGPMVIYLERVTATLARSTVQSAAAGLAHFGRFLAEVDPNLESLALLDRRRHVEPYLSVVAGAINRRTGAPITASSAKARIQTVGRFLDAITEWGWPEAPARRLIFPRDSPRLPHPLPRYLPPDHDRALVQALEASPNRLRADALLLLRATGLRIGELLDLELDCVHEIPGQGAWLKVPLGKLLTERMVPIDDETVEVIDRIVANRSPGRPLRHPRTRQLVEFLLTH
jgi:site-specific recombinase XerD